MLDYDLKLEGMNEKQVNDEVSRLSNMILSHSDRSSTFQQLLAMYEMAQMRQQELMMLANAPKDETIELGEVDEDIYYPDYTKQELLDAVVTQYNTPKDK